ncbi:efflux RND transporter periplasmic adaptor subunit [Marinobacter confluentis]|uniref:HlyD family efflux transporter periplasmic adaptor subunit n=1 Tax=Marinobacter confluentis TaxID=1697557 RepID=A0A4Z1BI89_9GAMM|nr:HlyD family efflux transporter periplasmic adaptor subunit [Marinobacter confluentis]TGN39279.1 HlyD family efflux transporter periplasmic adaptor subunit [Marinobacter confluentis]
MVRRFIPLIILAIGIGGFLVLKASRPEPESVSVEERAWLVETMPIELSEQVPVLPLYGELVAPEQLRITASLAGRVAALPVREGQQVAPGDLLVAMDKADVQPMLDQALADVSDLQAQVSAETIRAANDRKALASEQAILESAERQYQRTRSLVDRNLASREDLDAVTDALARARLTVTVRERAIAEHLPRLNSLNARLARADAALASTRLNVARATVTSPFEGVVTDLQVAPGDRVNQNAPLLSVYPLQGLELRASVPDRYLAELMSALREGQRLEARTVDGQHVFNLQRFAGTSDPSGTEVILVLQSPGSADHGLRPGGLLPVMLQRPPADNAAVIPHSALYGSDSVYLMTEANRMRRVRVERLGEIAAANGERQLLIASPELANGQSLITTHLPNAMSGLRVQLAGSDDGAPE